MVRPLRLALVALAMAGCGDANLERAREEYNQGLRLARGDENRKAITAFSAAIRLKPDYVNAYLNRGYQYDALGQPKQAIADFSMAIHLHARYSKAYFNRGNVYLRIGKYKLSIADFSQAIRLTPNDAEAYHNRGNAYRKSQQYPLAFRDYTKALEFNRNDGLAHYNRALTCLHAADADGAHQPTQLQRQNNFKQAINDLSDFLRLHPNVASAYQLRGIAHRENGAPKKAADDFAQAKALEAARLVPQPEPSAATSTGPSEP